MSERSGLISLDKGKRRTRWIETKEAGEPVTEPTREKVTTVTPMELDEIRETMKMHGVQMFDNAEWLGDVDAKVKELSTRLMETDSTIAVVSQRQEVGMTNMNTRLNEHNEKLDDMNLRLIDVETANRTADVLEAKISALDARIGSETRRLDMRCNTLMDRVVEVEKGVGETSDMTEQVEILRDKVRSQEAIIAELEGKVAKLETDVGETFAEAGRMIRDVKDESTQKVEEIAKEMETRLMERSQEETDEKLKEATRIQNKDITVMKQKMENVFSRMKRVEEDPTLKAIRLEAEQTRRDARAMMWVSAGSLITSMAVALVMVFRLAGGF